MNISPWTSSYSASFRSGGGDGGVLSPNAGEPMFHFAQSYDPSHYTRDPGFFGSRAELAQTARRQAEAQGDALRVRLPEAGRGPVGYGEAPRKQIPSHVNHSFYAPPPEPQTQNFSALRQNASGQLQTTRVQGGSALSQATLGPDGFAASTSPSSVGGRPQQKDLWNSQILPYSNGASARPSANSSLPAGRSPSHTQSFNHSAPFQSTSSSSGVGLIDPSFVDAPEDWRYDSRGVAMTKAVDLNRNTDPRHRFHVPGYSGYVRGKQFVYGETFGKQTRQCLDVPLDLPRDIPN